MTKTASTSSSWKRMFRRGSKQEQQLKRSNATQATAAIDESLMLEGEEIDHHDGDIDDLSSNPSTMTPLPTGKEGTEVLMTMQLTDQEEEVATSQTLYQVGLGAFTKKDYHRALKCFRRALREFTQEEEKKQKKMETNAVPAEESADIDGATTKTSASTTTDHEFLRDAILLHMIHSHLELSKEKDDAEYAEANKCLEQLTPITPSKRQELSTPAFASKLLFNFFLQHQDLDRALIQATELGMEPSVLARIHYQRGVSSDNLEDSLENLNRTLALTTSRSSGSRVGEAETKLREEARLAIIQSHVQHDDFDTAMELHEKTKRTSITEKARGQLQKAELCIAAHQNRKALDALEQGLDMVSKEEEATRKVKPQLLKAKADLLFKTGWMEEALDIYQILLDRYCRSTAEETKLLYTMGRMALRKGDPKEALGYSKRELAIVKKALGKTHLDVARIYQDMAKLCDEHLVEYDQALVYYNKALQIERWNLKDLQKRAIACKDVNTALRIDSQIKEVSKLLQVTQKAIGRIYYKTGDFERAIQSTFRRG